MLLQQVRGLDCTVERCSVWNLEGTVIDKHAVLEDSCWLELHEFTIWAQQAGARFVESQGNVAEEYRSLDDWRRIKLQAEPHRVHRGQRLARDAVSAERNCWLDRVSKSTLWNPAFIY